MSSIEERMAQLEGRVATLEGTVAALRAAQAAGAMPGGSAGAGGPRIASDADLDGQYGDPVIKFEPRDWTGRSYIGMTLSRTEPDYLDMYAQFKERSAEREEANPEKKKYARFSRADAARARGWAARMRAGKVKKAAPAPPSKPKPVDPWGSGGGTAGGDKDDEIPFISSLESAPCRRRDRWLRW